MSQVLTPQQVATINRLLVDNAAKIKAGQIVNFSINLSLNDVTEKERVKITNVVLPLAPLQY